MSIRNVSARRTSYGMKTDEDMASFDELYDMYSVEPGESLPMSPVVPTMGYLH